MQLKDGAFGGGREGFVDQVDDGGGETEAIDDLADKGGAGGVLGGEGGGDAPLAAEEEVDGWVVGKEALGRAGEGLAVDGLHELAEAGSGEETAKLGVAAGAGVGEVAADGEELVSLRHVDPGGDGDLGGVDVEVEAAAGGFFEAGAGPPGGGVRLVRALVAGEADITVDAHERLLRGADVLGGEGEHGFVDLGDDGEHGLLELALEDVAAGFEPEAVVVAFEAAKEAEGGGGEVGRHEGMVPGGGGACRGASGPGRLCAGRCAVGRSGRITVRMGFARPHRWLTMSRGYHKVEAKRSSAEDSTAARFCSISASREGRNPTFGVFSTGFTSGSAGSRLKLQPKLCDDGRGSAATGHGLTVATAGGFRSTVLR